jgi:membrane protein implicated in regulation of membrane protease activity
VLVVVSKHTSRKGCNGMIVDFVTMYAWIFWVGLLLLFVIVEVLTVDLTFLMLAGGWGGGLLALLLLFVARPALKRALGRTSDQTPTNVAALLGTGGMVTTPFVDGQGHVKLANGETWTARLSQATTDRPVDAGERVVVTAIEGATAIVVPAEGTAL